MAMYEMPLSEEQMEIRTRIYQWNWFLEPESFILLKTSDNNVNISNISMECKKIHSLKYTELQYW